MGELLNFMHFSYACSYTTITTMDHLLIFSLHMYGHIRIQGWVIIKVYFKI